MGDEQRHLLASGLLLQELFAILGGAEGDDGKADKREVVSSKLSTSLNSLSSLSPSMLS